MTPATAPCEPLTFSFLLPAANALTSNREVHYQVRAKRVREIRETVRLAVRNPRAILGQVDVDCALTWGDNRRRDAPNWWPSLKPAVDELVTLGVLPDDSNRYIRKTSIWPTEPQPGMKGYVRFVVTIRQVGQSVSVVIPCDNGGIDEAAPDLPPRPPLLTETVGGLMNKTDLSKSRPGGIA